MPTLSAILITKNEILNLEDCLSSLTPLVDEIIIVDSQSEDGTLEVAKKFGAKIFQPTDWPGFGPQKNRALDQASQEWVLSIDADERLTPELIAEIKLCLTHPGQTTCFSLPRLSQYCGKFMRHGGWYPDYVDRLFLNGHARFSDHLVHERLLPEGRPLKLKNPLLHYSYRNFEQVISKVNSYSSLGAKQAFSQGKQATAFSAIVHGSWAFIRTYFLRLGFLDGNHGLLLAFSNGQTSYYKYVKLWHLCQDSKKST
ncbi:MAG: glycosyltransferase family 2 protein [Betaproteobacteria bacterium]